MAKKIRTLGANPKPNYEEQPMSEISDLVDYWERSVEQDDRGDIIRAGEEMIDTLKQLLAAKTAEAERVLERETMHARALADATAALESVPGKRSGT